MLAPARVSREFDQGETGRGRKNLLFSGSPRGADASAIMYTRVGPAKAHNLEPCTYLNYLFEKLPAAESEQTLVSLLPQNLKVEGLKR